MSILEQSINQRQPITIRKTGAPLDSTRESKDGAPAPKPRRDTSLIPLKLVGDLPPGFAQPPTYPIEEPKPLTKPIKVTTDPGPPGYKKNYW